MGPYSCVYFYILHLLLKIFLQSLQASMLSIATSLEESYSPTISYPEDQVDALVSLIKNNIEYSRLIHLEYSYRMMQHLSYPLTSCTSFSPSNFASPGNLAETYLYLLSSTTNGLIPTLFLNWDLSSSIFVTLSCTFSLPAPYVL